jgi:hypothetical protein
MTQQQLVIGWLMVLLIGGSGAASIVQDWRLHGRMIRTEAIVWEVNEGSSKSPGTAFLVYEVDGSKVSARIHTDEDLVQGSKVGIEYNEDDVSSARPVGSTDRAFAWIRFLVGLAGSAVFTRQGLRLGRRNRAMYPLTAIHQKRPKATRLRRYKRHRR